MAGTTTMVLEAEVHPAELVTVKPYAPGTNPRTTVVAPLPVTVTPPGTLFMVHPPPPFGRPDKATLP